MQRARLLLLTAALLPGLSAEEAPAGKPNILFYLFDDIDLERFPIFPQRDHGALCCEHEREDAWAPAAAGQQCGSGPLGGCF